MEKIINMEDLSKRIDDYDVNYKISININDNCGECDDNDSCYCFEHYYEDFKDEVKALKLEDDYILVPLNASNSWKGQGVGQNIPKQLDEYDINDYVNIRYQQDIINFIQDNNYDSVEITIYNNGLLTIACGHYDGYDNYVLLKCDYVLDEGEGYYDISLSNIK